MEFCCKTNGFKGNYKLGGIKSVSILEANKTLKDVIGDGKTTFLEGVMKLNMQFQHFKNQ